MGGGFPVIIPSRYGLIFRRGCEKVESNNAVVAKQKQLEKKLPTRVSVSYNPRVSTIFRGEVFPSSPAISGLPSGHVWRSRIHLFSTFSTRRLPAPPIGPPPAHVPRPCTFPFLLSYCSSFLTCPFFPSLHYPNGSFIFSLHAARFVHQYSWFYCFMEFDFVLLPNESHI